MLGSSTLIEPGFPIKVPQQANQDIIWNLVAKHAREHGVVCIHHGECQHIFKDKSAEARNILIDSFKSLLRKPGWPLMLIFSGVKGLREFIMTDCISTEQCVGHNPEVGDGLKGFGKSLKDVMKSGQLDRYVKVHDLLGQGSFVVICNLVQQGGADWAWFDLFRLQGSAIVERWHIKKRPAQRRSGTILASFEVPAP